MINLSRHIEYQLLYHDTIVVPRLGTFKAIYVPSKWIEDEELLMPPYRALTFTQEIDETDTRFIETISTNYQISIEEANIATLEFTENIQQELAEYGNFELGSIGEFVQEDGTKQILFIPCKAGVASPWLYGLDTIHAHSSKKEILPTQKQEKKKVNVVSTDSKHVTISINKHLLNYVASVAAAIVLFFAFSTPISENAFNKRSQSEFFYPTNLISGSKEIPVKTENEVEASASDSKTITEVTATEKQQTEEIKTASTYAVVLCCGVPVQNAESYCQNLNGRGIKAVVDNSGKFIRVLIPGFTSKEDALKEIRSLLSKSKEFSNAWVMEKQ